MRARLAYDLRPAPADAATDGATHDGGGLGVFAAAGAGGSGAAIGALTSDEELRPSVQGAVNREMVSVVSAVHEARLLRCSPG